MKRILLYSLFCLFAFQSVAQDNQLEQINQQVEIGTAVNDQGILSFSFDAYTMDKRISNGVVLIKLDMGDNYVSDPAIPFTGQVEVTLEALQGGVVIDVLDQNTAILNVNQDQPESYYSIDLQDFKAGENVDESFSFDALRMTVTEATLPADYYGTTIRLTASSTIDLGLKVSTLKSEVAAIEVNDQILVSDKVANFKWANNYPITNYQVQVLRLYNNDEATTNTPQIITTSLDWTKAMNFEGKASVDNNDNTKFFTLTLAEGTGFYVFRVRPIGAYYQGGIVDQRNWGDWSTHDPQNTPKDLDFNTVALPYFYFTDPDENRNWIYNRVFTENNKVKENMNFANGLQQSRQSQTYLPSQDITLVTQTILDHTGRPTVTTIPIPLGGRVSEYQEGLVKANGTEELYQAKHFDNEENFNDPTATVPFSYYDNNDDKNIPNDNGYGFTRTIYYNESSGRILKQSGVGATHKIGSEKTTRYLHATASEDELIALFGDEAPDSESVIKTITIDPNNIASVSYTSKEGNVIATSLAFYEQNTNLTALDEPVNITEVKDKITNNSKTAEGFVSSKRISLLQDNPNFKVSYSIACHTFEQLCQIATVDCDYQLAINIIKLGANGNMINKQELISESLSSIPCDNVGGEEYKIVAPDSIYLEAGSYIIEKRLLVGDAALSIADNAANISKQVDPITDLIAGWLESIEDASMLNDFNKSLYDLSKVIEEGNLNTFTNGALAVHFPVDFPQEFIDETYPQFKDQYILAFELPDYDPYGADAGENPISFTLGTPCCIITIPVKWIPPFDCTADPVVDANENNIYDVVNLLDLADNENPVQQEYLPDFEGYMLAYMSDCIGPDLDFASEQALKNVIYGIYMDGWEIEGTFNMMIYHMLKDKYNTNNTVEGVAEVKEQYDCDLLLGCWQSQLNRLKSEICTKFNFYEDAGKANVSNEFDTKHDEDETQEGADHNSHFDDNFKGGFFLIKWIAKKKISKRMRDLQAGGSENGAAEPELGQFHLVQEFLECTNYQFAKIITPFDAEPLSQDVDEVFTQSNTYAIASDEVPVPLSINHSVTKSDYFGGSPDVLLKNGGYDYGYIPLDDWNPRKRTITQAAKDNNWLPDHPNYFELSEESLFPNIKNPIYAFKYFEYAEEGNSNAQSLEVSICYSDPNDCYELDNNGYIKLTNGIPKKIPCCSADPAWDAEGCYADTQYPNLNQNMVGYGTDGQGVAAKYVVTDFCELGRVVCPYTKDAWSAGQRLTFYTMLKTYVIPDEDSDWEEVADIDITCDQLNTVKKWYAFTGPLELQEEKNLPDIVYGGYYNFFLWNLYKLYYTQLTLNDGTEEFRYIELEMEDQVDGCNSGCDGKRGAFKNKLTAMLLSKCYEIGGCRTEDASTFHIIPEEDLDYMVDEMMKVCKSQCKLTTFSCQATPCRSVDRPFISTGFDLTDFDIKYGMGGFDPQFCEDPNYSYSDNTDCADPDNDGIFECELLDPVTGAVNPLSWYEYTRLKQATTWDFDVDMPTMCLDENDNPIATEDDIDCEGCVPDEANTFAGDTFVPKGQYEVKSITAPDSNAPSIGEQVITPAIGIHVEIDPNE